VKTIGYGLLGLMPDQLFSLTLPEFYDMVRAKQYYTSLESDTDMQRTAWQTSLIMTSSGNYGKKGVTPDKLYKSVFDKDGNFIGNTGQETFKPIDKEEKEKQLSKLIEKFNKK
jgi:hypothetical protein